MGVIRKQGLKFQVAFWVAIISMVSFLALFGFNYWYFRTQLVNNLWSNLQAVSELASMSNMFYSVDELLDTGKSTDDLDTLLLFIDDLAEKSGVDGIYVYYQSRDMVYQIQPNGFIGPLKDDINASDGLLDVCAKLAYTGRPERYMEVMDGVMVYYYAQPVSLDLNHKFGVCAYVGITALELALIRFIMFNLMSLFVVSMILMILLIYAVNKVVINPIIDIERIIDSFVYQVSGGYMTFAMEPRHGNEISVLKSSVKRLEGLVKTHFKLMHESKRYREWLKGKSDSDTVEMIGRAAQFEALCDTDTMTGNRISWALKRAELDSLLGSDSLDTLYVTYLIFDGVADVNGVLDKILNSVGVKGIPLDAVFRVSDTDFVFIFGRRKMMDQLAECLKAISGVRFGCVSLVPEKHKSAQDIINDCMAEIRKGGAGDA